MSKATEAALSELHRILAEQMTRVIQGVPQVEEVLDPETGEVVSTKTTTRMPTASELAAAAKFLKDNNITVAPGEGGALDELDKALAARRSAKLTSSELDQVRRGFNA